MRPRFISLLLPAFLLTLFGCGEEKDTAPRDDTPPVEGRAGRPDAPPPTVPDLPQPPPPNPSKDPTPQPPKSPPADSLSLPIFLLNSPADPPPALHNQILEAANSSNLDLETIPSGDLEKLKDPHILIAPLPLPPDFPNLGDESFLILVGTPIAASLPPHLTHLHPDDRAIGTAAANHIISEIARQSELRGRASITGNVVQIRASDDDPASQLRHEGFLEVLDRHAGVIFVHDGPGFWHEADAQKRMEEALRIQKDIRFVFAHSDAMAAGAKSAIAAYRKSHPGTPKIPVLGVGGATLESISLNPLAQKALGIATRLQSTPDFRPPAIFKISPH